MNASPGQAPLCRSCRHWSEPSWSMGLPAPCACVRWIGQHHVSPTLAGGVCSGFEPMPIDVTTEADAIPGNRLLPNRDARHAFPLPRNS